MLPDNNNVDPGQKLPIVVRGQNNYCTCCQDVAKQYSVLTPDKNCLKWQFLSGVKIIIVRVARMLPECSWFVENTHKTPKNTQNGVARMLPECCRTVMILTPDKNLIFARGQNN